ncbi:hypothetical protein MASR1M45_18920 [Candidatus Kapaibacterium sp.]
MLGTGRDITERKMIEEDLARSEAIYRELIELAVDGILVGNTGGQILLANSAFCEMTGLERGEIIGKHISEIPFEEHSVLSKPFRFDLLDEGLIVENNRVLIRPDGTKVYVEMRTKKMPDNTYQSIYRNISERIFSEAAIKESEERYRILSDTTSDFTFSYLQIDENYVLNWVTGATQKVTGYTSSQILKNQSLDFMIYNEDLQEFRNQFLTTEPGVSKEIQVRILKNNHELKWLKFSIKSTYDDITNKKKIYGSCTDITEKKLAEEELRLKNIELAQLNSSKDKFFSIIAHDLRSPFSGFLGLTRIMAEDIDNLTMKEVQEVSRKLKESAENLYKLIDNLLEWSRIQRGVMSFEPVKCSPSHLVRNILDITAETFKNKGLQATNNIPPDLYVNADMQMLNSVLRNLISNAIKFTPAEGKIEIGLSEVSNDELATIFVRDSGIGMSEEMMNNLFRIDKKVSRLGTDGEPSTGLGLLLCKEFIEKHNGQIRVESDTSSGSTFYITLPIWKKS